MKTKMRHRINLSVDRGAMTVFDYVNTSDEQSVFLLFHADKIEGSFYLMAENDETRCRVFSDRSVHHASSGLCFAETDFDFLDYPIKTLSAPNVKRGVSHGEKYALYDIPPYPDVFALVVCIAPHDRAIVECDVMDFYETIEEDNRAQYRISDLNDISYKLKGDTITLDDERLASLIYITLYEKNNDFPESDLYIRYVERCKTLKMSELPRAELKMHTFTEDDFERVKKMIEWWHVEQDPEKYYLIWVKPVENQD